ncbi:MAG: DUF5676 family membrane protein [Nanoarchaeota archaeon]|nr:DUF5676 family membrane protein [Nanoarchaeota archaeon]
MAALKPLTVALATGSTASILSLVCSVLVGTSPVMMQRMAGVIMHSFAVVPSYNLTAGGIVGGLVLWFVMGGAAGLVFAWLYNLYSKKLG